jgi:hypothetical protein
MKRDRIQSIFGVCAFGWSLELGVISSLASKILIYLRKAALAVELVAGPLNKGSRLVIRFFYSAVALFSMRYLGKVQGNEMKCGAHFATDRSTYAAVSRSMERVYPPSQTSAFVFDSRLGAVLGGKVGDRRKFTSVAFFCFSSCLWVLSLCVSIRVEWGVVGALVEGEIPLLGSCCCLFCFGA